MSTSDSSIRISRVYFFTQFYLYNEALYKYECLTLVNVCIQLKQQVCQIWKQFKAYGGQNICNIHLWLPLLLLYKQDPDIQYAEEALDIRSSVVCI